MSDQNKAATDNRANQLNSNNSTYWSGRGQTKPSAPPPKPASQGSGAKGGTPKK